LGIVVAHVLSVLAVDVNPNSAWREVMEVNARTTFETFMEEKIEKKTLTTSHFMTSRCVQWTANMDVLLGEKSWR
jgi:hypothetical protein